MCFERSTASGWELTAPDRSDNSHTLSARWLDSAAHCKIRLQTCRGAGAGTASPAPGRVGVAGGGSLRLDRPLGSAAYRWLAGAPGGQLGRLGEAARRPRAGRSQPLDSDGVTRPGPMRCRGSLQLSLGRLAGLSSVAAWRQTEGWRAVLQGIGRKWRTQAARKPLAENSN